MISLFCAAINGVSHAELKFAAGQPFAIRVKHPA